MQPRQVSWAGFLVLVFVFFWVPEAKAAVSFVGSGGVSGTSFTFDIGTAGTDRAVVVIAGDQSSGNNLTGVTVDGKACNLVTRADNPAGNGNHQEMWYCDEDDLGASNGMVTVAIAGGGGTWGTHAHLYTGVGQNGPTDFGIDETSAGVATVTVNGIDVPAGGLVVMGAGEGTGGLTVSSWTAPLTERQAGPHPNSADLFSASDVEASAQTNKTYVATFSANFNRATGIVAVWPQAGVADHMVVTATDGTAPAGGTEVLSLQLVDDLGNAISSALDVTVTVTGSATFSANDIGGTNGSNTLNGTLAADGSGSVTITNAVIETVTVSADATGDAQTVANVDDTVDFTSGLFGYRKSITIDRTKIPGTCGTTLSDFPILFSVTDPDLRTTGNGGNVVDAEGDDIIFRGLDEGTCGGVGTSPCALDHEIEQYDETTGELVAWVRVPSVNTNAAGSDTVVYIYYGNTAVTVSSENATGVWDANYQMVQHLHDSQIRWTYTFDWVRSGPENFYELWMQLGDSTTMVAPGTSDSTGVAVNLKWAGPNHGMTTDEGFGHVTNGGATTTQVATVTGSHTIEVVADLNAKSYEITIDNVSQATGVPFDNDVSINAVRIYADEVNQGNFNTRVFDDIVITDAAQTTLFSDDFNRANSNAVGNGWSETEGGSANAKISGNTLVIDTTDEINLPVILHTFPSILDSTSNDTDGTNNGSTDVVGKIANAQDFVRASDTHVDLGNPAILNFDTNDWTLSAWVQTSDTTNQQNIISNGGDNIGGIRYVMAKGEGVVTDTVVITTDDDVTKVQAFGTTTIDSSPATFHHATVVRDGTVLRTYIDGVEEGTNTVPVGYDLSGASQRNSYIGIGIREDTGVLIKGFNGIIDEARISDVARNACWIGGEFNNQDDPGSFYTIGGEESGPPTLAKVTTLSATADSQGGVLVEWRTSYEVDNLGFHVYREEGGQRLRITPELVAGSALFAGSRTELTAGRSYAWWDPQGTSGARYWLEDVDLNGQRTWHGPATPSGSLPQKREASRSLLLSQLGRDEPRKRVFVSSGPAQPGPPQTSAVTVEERRQRQWTLASQPTVKLEVQEKGWYRVEQAELLAAELSPGVNPRFLQLWVDGEEQPLVVQGESDDSFDPGDAIQFYGTGLDTPWTETRTYWLVEGGELGQRIPFVNPEWAAQAEPESFPFTVERKERTIYVAAVKNGEAGNFFGPLVNSTTVEQVMAVHHLDGVQAEAQLEISLQGLGQDPHQVKVLLNTMEVGSVSFLGPELKTASFTFPVNGLEEGENIVALVAEGGETDVSLLDVIRLTYWHTYTADSNTLEFTVQGPSEGGLAQPVTIGGFSSNLIGVIDVTDPEETLELQGLVQPQEEGYTITVGVPAAGLRRLVAVTEEQVKLPATVKADQPSAWHDVDSRAQVLIITHRDFLHSVEPLKALREAQGYSVAVVDVEDLYDEFAFGAKTPWALRDFVEWASKQWKTRPRFIVLVGDATLDPRDYLGFGDLDFVPTRLVETAFLETASDDWFVDFNLDGLPELAVGRLPVQTTREAESLVAKIVAYDQDPEGAWRQNILLVADEHDQFSDFEQTSAKLKSVLSQDLAVGEIFRGKSAGTARMELLGKLNQGQLVVNYLGHGSVEVWAGNLLNSQDARALNNGSRLPFFMSLTCLNGFFHDPAVESLAEALLRNEQGGAIAVWTSSALTAPQGQFQLTPDVLRLVSQGFSLGEAVARAKAFVSDPDVRRSWIFFGDPLTTINELLVGDTVSFPDLTNQEITKLVSEEGISLAEAAAVENPSPDNTPPELGFPLGFFDFAVQGTPVGQTTTVTIFLDTGVVVNTYWKFGPTPDQPLPHWYEFLYDGRIGAEILSDRIVVHFADGERGDDDLTANGEIRSLGGLAFSAPPVVPSVAQISYALNSNVTTEEMFVGMAVVNPNDYSNAVSFTAVDSAGREVDRVVLAEVPAQGQDAFLIDEVFSPFLGEVSVIARGQEGPIQSFFLIGEYALTRLDGVAGEFQAATQLYFPISSDNTVLFVFNPTSQAASAAFRLLDQDGVPLQEVSITIAGGGFAAQEVEDLFGIWAGGTDYIQVESEVPLMGFEFMEGAEDFSAISAQVPQSATRLLLPHFFVDDQGSTTEIRLLQTGDTPVAVTVQAFDDSSTLLAKTEFELAPKTLFVGEVGELLSLDGMTTGYLELGLEGSPNVVGAATFTTSLGAGQGTRATLPLIHGGRTRTSFLQVSQSQQLAMFTGLAILNAGSETATVTVQAFDTAGNQSGEAEFELEAGSRRVGLLNEAMFFGEGFNQVKGHLQVNSSTPVVTFALFGDYGLTYLSAIEGQQGLK